ncbi:hypothetical protein SDC9_178146 [bioreactor metagenome]|uniref:Uncharacterized protein n=1 Tax=bioreactor metagenome TaxID=1076179 RepID=A0A645GV56_9ZZZZ
MVQLDDPLATHELDWVMAVGDDEDIGGEGVSAERGQHGSRCNGNAAGRPSRPGHGKEGRHVRHRGS